MIEIEFLVTYLLARWQQAGEGDRGSVTLEKVVITAVLVIGAIAVGGIIVQKATDGANNLETGP